MALPTPYSAIEIHPIILVYKEFNPNNSFPRVSKNTFLIIILGINNNKYVTMFILELTSAFFVRILLPYLYFFIQLKFQYKLYYILLINTF